MKKLKSKKKKKPKNPILKWLCFICHHNKSTKTVGHVVNAITLKCSICDEFLKYHSTSDNYNDGLARCAACSNAISLPLCASCGEPMQEFDASLDELKANIIENDEPIPMRKKNKNWWKL